MENTSVVNEAKESVLNLRNIFDVTYGGTKERTQIDAKFHEETEKNIGKLKNQLSELLNDSTITEEEMLVDMLC